MQKGNRANNQNGETILVLEISMGCTNRKFEMLDTLNFISIQNLLYAKNYSLKQMCDEIQRPMIDHYFHLLRFNARHACYYSFQCVIISLASKRRRKIPLPYSSKMYSEAPGERSRQRSKVHSCIASIYRQFEL